MSKFYDIIKNECDYLYDMYIVESKADKKAELLSRFTIAYILQEKCFDQGEFDTVIEYLKLKSDIKRELNEIIELFGKDDPSAVDRANKLTELGKIEVFLKRA